MPWYISHTIDIYGLKHENIYFTPDKMIIMKKWKGIGSRSYNNLLANFTKIDLVETEFLPSDAEIIQHTWKYVNKSGKPDKRFRNNSQVPICKYGEINLTSEDGINILLYCSNHKLIPMMQEQFTEFIIANQSNIKQVENDKWNHYNAEYETTNLEE